MALLANGDEVVTPSKAEAALAGEAVARLAAHVQRDGVLRLELKSDGAAEELVLPASAVKLLRRVLVEMGEGHTVALTPLRSELSTRQAADLLNVSHSYLLALLEEGAIPSRPTEGNRDRRVMLDDLLAYKSEIEAKRHEALDELAALSQDLKLGY